MFYSKNNHIHTNFYENRYLKCSKCVRTVSWGVFDVCSNCVWSGLDVRSAISYIYKLIWFVWYQKMQIREERQSRRNNSAVWWIRCVSTRSKHFWYATDSYTKKKNDHIDAKIHNKLCACVFSYYGVRIGLQNSIAVVDSSVDPV